MSYLTRPVTARDVDFLWLMLLYASHSDEDGTTDAESLKARPELSRYVAGWGRPGDLGVLALEGATGRPVGAAWLRLLADPERGYGYVDDQTPELAIATAPGHRGGGAGTLLLRELLGLAGEQFESVSLSVRLDNPARRLYERMGFLLVPGSEQPNRVGGLSAVMLARGLTDH